jgi:hypothetical protein
MRNPTSRRNRYPSHWPVHVTALPEARQPLPPPGAETNAQSPEAVHPADDGELTASPWIGLYYRGGDS